MADLAIIGSGIAGLGCAHFLHRHHRISVFEQDPRIGGHAHTIEVPEGHRTLPVDTGFMVYNEVTYPLLTRLFAELDVPTKPTSMSFSVRHEPAGLEYCGSSLNHLFAQRRNLLRPRFWRLLLQVNRFNGEAAAALRDPLLGTMTLGEYVRLRGYGDDFLHLYLLPMSCAVWSAPPEEMLAFPATTLLRFFHNHGFLGLHTQHPWRTVQGGSRTYVQKLTAPFRHRLQSGQPIRQVRRDPTGVELFTDHGSCGRFDQVIFACHADQALRLLAEPTPRERALLGAFRYQPNDAIVHTDTAVMPATRLAWASWNYRIRTPHTGGAAAFSTHYWMNSLQGVSETTPYFVSLNAADGIDPAKIVRRLAYEHPLFDAAALRAQAELPQLNQLGLGRDQSTFFCGSYFRYGFHEDGLLSAYHAAAAVLGRDPWPKAGGPAATPTAVPAHAPPDVTAEGELALPVR